MIRTVTVYTGDSDYTKAAQLHGIDIAGRFEARLKVVSLWDAGSAEEVASAEQTMKLRRQDIVMRASGAGIRAVEESRGDGMTRGLLDEARKTDLLVLGIPTESQAEGDDMASRLFREQLPVIREAESAVLAVSEPPQPFRKIVVQYDAGNPGKAMLRLAGAIAEKYRAEIAVLTLDDDLSEAARLAAAAAEYLQGFDVPGVETMPKTGTAESKVQIMEAAGVCGADLIAIGEAGHGVIERLLGQNTAERTALATVIPLLIAR